ncbi:MAG: hypothetical protein U0269_30800 [Polyangiales bacterium]
MNRRFGLVRIQNSSMVPRVRSSGSERALEPIRCGRTWFAVLAALTASSCGVAVHPTADGDVVGPSPDATAESGRDVSSDTAPDSPANDGASDVNDASEPPPPPNATISVINTRAPTTHLDSFEAMRVIAAPSAATPGGYTIASGPCSVDVRRQPAFEPFAESVSITLNGSTVAPSLTVDRRQEWVAQTDTIQPETRIVVEARSSDWPSRWQATVPIPAFITASITPQPLPPQFHVRMTDAIQIGWSPMASARVELAVSNLVFNESLRSFDRYMIRCEYAAAAGSASIRLSDHPAFQLFGAGRDNIVLTLNSIERQLVRYPAGSVEITARSESALVSVVIQP